jgi:N4-gp56 family major capsid protein
MAVMSPDPVNFTDSTAWTLLVENAYDKAVEFKRREMPLFRQFFNKKVVSPTNDSDTYVFTLHNDFTSLSTTPLTETTSPSALQVQAPSRVTVTVAEYGAYAVDTIFLQKVAFTQPRSELVELLARQQGDTVDKLSKNVIDASTNVFRTASRTSNVTIATADVVNAQELRKIRNTMDRNLNKPLGGGNEFVMVAHPDVLYDIRNESGAHTWAAPHVYSDPSNIYSGEIGSYMGLRFISATRCTSLAGAGAGGINLPVSYVFADQAVAEVPLQEPTTVIGPVVDPLKRFYTVGWKMTWGAALYRTEALLKVHSSTSFA